MSCQAARQAAVVLALSRRDGHEAAARALDAAEFEALQACPAQALALRGGPRGTPGSYAQQQACGPCSPLYAAVN